MPNGNKLAKSSLAVAFNSYLFLKFLGIFLPIYWVLVWLARPPIRKYLLLIASFTFWVYAGNDHFRNLIFISVSLIGNYLIYYFLTRKKSPQAIWSAILLNLGILFYYSSFFFHYVLRPLLYENDNIVPFWPLGIAFYSLSFIQFHSDLIRQDKMGPVSKTDFILFGSFFPASNAGPIPRWRELQEKFSGTLPAFYSSLLKGSAWILLGLVKKTYLAELLFEYSESVFKTPYSYAPSALWIAFYVNAAQLYLDFSGYVDMGRGAARLFGYRLPRNFVSPFFSKSIREVLFSWNRTLAVFFRGSVYYICKKSNIPSWVSLGFLCISYSLWYLFSWEGFLFSAFLFSFLWIEKRIPIRISPRWIGSAIRILLTFHCIGIVFTLIRFPRWNSWLGYWKAFGGEGTGTLDDYGLFAIVILGITILIQLLERKFKRFFL